MPTHATKTKAADADHDQQPAQEPDEQEQQDDPQNDSQDSPTVEERAVDDGEHSTPHASSDAVLAGDAQEGAAGGGPPNTRELRLNLNDDEGDHYAEELELPMVAVNAIRGRIADALDHAAVARRGAVVIGPKGIGKSVALKQAVVAFHRAEALKEGKNAGYARRSVFLLPTLTDRSYREALLLLCQKVIGPTFRHRVYGAPKKDDALLEELLRACLDQRIVTFAFGEAERMSREVIRLLRDIIADATYFDGDGITANDSIRASGVGVLLVGTKAVRPLVDNSGEAGHRWTLLVELTLMPATAAPDVYVTWFPAFEAHVARIGDAQWKSFVAEHVTHGRPVSLSTLQEHARLYFRRAHRALRKQGQPALTRASIPFSARLFIYTIKELDTLRRRKDG